MWFKMGMTTCFKMGMTTCFKAGMTMGVKMMGRLGKEDVVKLKNLREWLGVSNDGCMPLQKLDDAVFGPVDVFALT